MNHSLVSILIVFYNALDLMAMHFQWSRVLVDGLSTILSGADSGGRDEGGR